jgi:energy-coupling factor transporter transmembrane protein EcfT
MVYDYLISLRRPDYKVVDIISQLLYLIAFAAFIFFATKSAGIVNAYWIAAIIIVVCYLYVRVKKARKGLAYYTSGLAIAAITWVAGPNTNWLMFALYLACTLLERELKFHKEVGFTPDEVVFNTLFKKHYEWPEFRNVLIKDGILTLDFKSNKVVQKEIEGDVPAEIEREFNEFCRQQLVEKDAGSMLPG